MWRRRILVAAAGVVLLLLAIQLVPYGRSHRNPPVLREPAWDSAATRRLAVAACFDCHSNLTAWPWYSKVAPVSWLVQSDVDEGRRTLNFSEWGSGQDEVDEIVEVVQEGEMPPQQYRLLHAGARLSAQQRQELAAGLEATLRASSAP